MKKLFCLCTVLLFALTVNTLNAQTIDLVKAGKTNYKIVVAADATKNDHKAATILQDYITRISGCKMEIITETKGIQQAIFIGYSGFAEVPRSLKNESFIIKTANSSVSICGRNGGGTLYGVYTFLEQYLHCYKLDKGPALVPASKDISIPASINLISQPSFIYRQAYFPLSADVEYLQWHGLQQLEDLWGLWGHSFDKLVPPSEYFKAHPEYYALVNGKRQPTQLCLSNATVLQLTIADLKKRMNKRPDAIYWSISPNDNTAYCQCNDCKKTEQATGAPSGVLIKFINQVASKFPEQNFTTLAYTYTLRPPQNIVPAANVYVFLSSIDAYRTKPLTEEPSAKAFVNYMKQWGAITSNIFVWDYTTQFTNYLAPFPDQHTIQSNFQYFSKAGVKGIFEQGSGDTYCDLAELKSYLYAKALWNADVNIEQETNKFISNYYGNAAPHVTAYFEMLTNSLAQTNARLDIYGNPVNDHRSYLSPQLLDKYNVLLDKAEASVEDKPLYRERIARMRLSLEYVVLQQSRFYGIQKHGMYEAGGTNGYTIKKGWPARVQRFAANAQKAGVTELSEGGLTPSEYAAEWQHVFDRDYVPNKALGAKTVFAQAYSQDYPANGDKTLTDGVTGYADYSYNWLLFPGVPMEVEITVPAPTTGKEVSMQFLNDERHWIVAPDHVEVFINGTKVNNINKNTNVLKGDISTVSFNAVPDKPMPVNTIRVKAWYKPERYAAAGRKPAITCDEIYLK